MLVKVWRLWTVMFVALSMGLALCHLLEMPAKMSYEGELWLTIAQTLYAQFGSFGAAFEIGALFSSAALVFLVRKRGSSFGWSLLAAGLVALAHLVFWIRVAPVNAEVALMRPGALPPGWEELRAQWEYGHAIRAALQIAALASLTMSILVETPAKLDSRESPKTQPPAQSARRVSAGSTLAARRAGR